MKWLGRYRLPKVFYSVPEEDLSGFIETETKFYRHKSYLNPLLRLVTLHRQEV